MAAAPYQPKHESSDPDPEEWIFVKFAAGSLITILYGFWILSRNDWDVGALWATERKSALPLWVASSAFYL